MGPAGCGKSTVGRALAFATGWPFVDGDDYHPPANVRKMRAGLPLTDADRAPWLATLHAILARAIDRREGLVLACSALKERYRNVLAGGLHPVRFVYLAGGKDLLHRRLENRSHFAGAQLLESQLADLEEPRDALVVDAAAPVDWIVATARRELGL